MCSVTQRRGSNSKMFEVHQNTTSNRFGLAETSLTGRGCIFLFVPPVIVALAYDISLADKP